MSLTVADVHDLEGGIALGNRRGRRDLLSAGRIGPPLVHAQVHAAQRSGRNLLLQLEALGFPRAGEMAVGTHGDGRERGQNLSLLDLLAAGEPVELGPRLGGHDHLEHKLLESLRLVHPPGVTARWTRTGGWE